MLNIIQAITREQVDEARSLFREYESWFGLDLCFQGFESELAELPGKYAPPDGRLFLAYSDEKLAGCIALEETKRRNLRNETALCSRRISRAADRRCN